MVRQTTSRNRLAAAAEPFKGITTNGAVIPDLFGLQQTGVSTKLIREAAEAFLASLSAEQCARTLFPVDTDQWRKWSNIHPTLLRHGMALFEMSDRQRDCAFALLRESLSRRGFEEALDLMHLNETVLELTGRLDEYGEDLYWLSIMGAPSATEPWGWQWDGHHLIINYFILGDQVVVTPTFLGAEPVHAVSGKYAGVRAFKGDEDRGSGIVPRAFTNRNGTKPSSRPRLPAKTLPPRFATTWCSITKASAPASCPRRNTTSYSACWNITSAACATAMRRSRWTK